MLLNWLNSKEKKWYEYLKSEYIKIASGLIKTESIIINCYGVVTNLQILCSGEFGDILFICHFI